MFAQVIPRQFGVQGVFDNVQKDALARPRQNQGIRKNPRQVPGMQKQQRGGQYRNVLGETLGDFKIEVHVQTAVNVQKHVPKDIDTLNGIRHLIEGFNVFRKILAYEFIDGGIGHQNVLPVGKRSKNAGLTTFPYFRHLFGFPRLHQNLGNSVGQSRWRLDGVIMDQALHL